MKGKRFFHLICLFLIGAFSHTLQAQVLFVDEEKFQFRVSHMDEFVHRMNLDTDCFGNPITSETDSLVLKKTLATLFTIDSIGKSYSDSVGIRLMDSLLTRRYPLKWTDNTVYTLATCKAKFKRKDVDLRLKLKMDTLQNGNRKWVIADAFGSFEDFMLKDSSVFLSPAMHGTNFMSLGGILDLNKNLLPCYAADSSRLDRLSLFFAWLYDGSLTIQGFQTIEYVFSHIPGLSFHVCRNDNMRGMTSGWQIVRIEQD